MSGITFLPIKQSTALRLADSNEEAREQQQSATVAALVGIAPKRRTRRDDGRPADRRPQRRDGMLPARHDRRTDLRGPAREPEPSQQAVPHLRHAARGAQSPSRQGPAKGHGRARPCACGRPSGRRHGRDTRGVGIDRNRRINPMQSKLPMHLSPRCGARTRSGSPCQSPAMPNGRCRMHGGKSPGAPKGNRNAWKHGRYSAEVYRAAAGYPPTIVRTRQTSWSGARKQGEPQL